MTTAASSEHGHHFVDDEQRRAAATLGMWVFLASEVMLFGGMFTAYAYYRASYPEAFAEGSGRLDAILGAANTAVLLTSSLTMALAVHSVESGNRRRLVHWLLATALLGCVFLGIKAYEYSHKFHEHLVPGAAFRFDSPRAEHTQMFMLLYFIMTGVHALHLVIGIAVLLVLAWRARNMRDSVGWRNQIETAGLYWHIVDVIWIFLFPLLYLIGRHG